jgi:uncharacterized protein YodC (DUF2158 family)
MPAVKIGDVVRLRSDGPPMTVFSLSDQGDAEGAAGTERPPEWICKWFVRETLRSDVFPETVLDVVDDDPSTLSDAEIATRIARLERKKPT